jgi:hypothetical protein
MYEGINLCIVNYMIVRSGEHRIEMVLLMADSEPKVLDLVRQMSQAGAFSTAWQGFAAGWDARWKDAFTPKNSKTAGHFSGSAPVLSLSSGNAMSPDLTLVYYMSVYTIISSERTNLPAMAPRVYLTGTGNAFFHNNIGGTVQFAWYYVKQPYKFILECLQL